MSLDPRDAFRGSLIVAGRELRSNARGLKVWIICGLTLLLVLAASFGIGGLASQGPSVAAENVVWAAPYWPANNSTAGIVVWVSGYLGTPHAAFPVLLGNAFPPSQPNPRFVERARLTTNATGWGTFPGVGPGEWPVRITVGAMNFTTGVSVPTVRPSLNFTVLLNRFDILGDGAARDVGFQVVRTDGYPAQGAQVYVNGTLDGTAGANGFQYHRYDDGYWNVTLLYRSQSEERDLTVQRSPFAILPYFQGPDALLLFLGVSLMGIVYPIVAIAMSYDAVVKERMQGSLELLLSRPASRPGIAIGKFLGSFLSVALPMLGVLLGAVVGIAVAEGRWPDAVFATAFVLGTLGLIATYVLIMQIFSTLARSPGSTILAAILVWFVFNFLWSLVFLGVQAGLNIETGTSAAFALSAITGLFNPNLVYTLTVTTFMPSSLLGLFGTTGGSLPDWTGPVAMIIWIAVLLVLAVLVFRKRIV